MKQEVVTISGKRYIINAWKTTTQIRNMPLIGKAFAVPLSLCFSEERPFEEVLPEALFALFTQMEEQDAVALFELILSNTFLNDEKVSLDDSFESIDEVLKVATKVINLNYGVLYSGKGLQGFLQEITPLSQAQD